MSHFPTPRSEFVFAGSKLQPVGAQSPNETPSLEVVPWNGHVFRFGIFELDPHTLELRRDGHLIHLRHQPARVLSLLLARSGRLVSREEITNELWPSDVDVDVEQGLNHCIKEIRAALGDQSEAPRYIQTLPRRGYRTLVEMHRVRGAAGEGASDDAAALRPDPAAVPVAGTAAAGAVRITISASRTGEPAPGWSASFDGFPHDIEAVERDFQSAFRLGLRPLLEAEAKRPADRGEGFDAAMALSRRGFE